MKVCKKTKECKSFNWNSNNHTCILIRANLSKNNARYSKELSCGIVFKKGILRLVVLIYIHFCKLSFFLLCFDFFCFILRAYIYFIVNYFHLRTQGTTFCQNI